MGALLLLLLLAPGTAGTPAELCAAAWDGADVVSEEQATPNRSLDDAGWGRVLLCIDNTERIPFVLTLRTGTRMSSAEPGTQRLATVEEAYLAIPAGGRGAAVVGVVCSEDQALAIDEPSPGRSLEILSRPKSATEQCVEGLRAAWRARELAPEVAGCFGDS